MPVPTQDRPLPHPAWKLAHAIVGLLGIVYLTLHGADADGGAAGAVGLASGARAAWMAWFMKG